MISALNESGQPVDWWFIYKVPKLSPGSNNDKATGYEYVYYDPTLTSVVKSPFVLFDPANPDSLNQGALNRTLNSVFNSSSTSIGWVLYNDEMPDAMKLTDDGNLGHTKGVLAFDLDSNNAFWLLHSWPKFAEPKEPKDPTPMYGQTYLCLSLDLDSVAQIAAQMLHHQEPQIYQKFLPAALAADHALTMLCQKLTPAPVGDSNILELKTRGNMPFKVIAKNRAWNRDFWNGLVGPTLREDMDVETWIRGEIAPIADTDGIHKTFDIKFINLGPLGAHWAWPESHDHAKWGITLMNNWVCVGDINRMVSQRKRGGGTIAFQNQTLWTALSKTNLLLAPPGHTRTEAVGVIHKTHPAQVVTTPATASPPSDGP